MFNPFLGSNFSTSHKLLSANLNYFGLPIPSLHFKYLPTIGMHSNAEKHDDPYLELNTMENILFLNLLLLSIGIAFIVGQMLLTHSKFFVHFLFICVFWGSWQGNWHRSHSLQLCKNRKLKYIL